jgi:CRISPR system Cascade subunit CasC
MFIELHILQNFAPSNLNRDDTGSPKSAMFGDYPRARISSQCIKRAIREEFKRGDILPKEHLAERTKLVVDAIADRLGRPREEVRPVVEVMLGSADLRLKEDKQRGEWKTEYLLYLGEAELDRATELCRSHWDVLAPLAAAAAPAGDGEVQRQGKRGGKAANANRALNGVKSQLVELLDGGKAADLALFGRMLADLQEVNIDAASQVAHAISTHKVAIEFDFFTAVDERNPKDTAGAGMLGTVEFNSACYYRYSNVDLRQLRDNLRGDAELAGRALEAFLTASVIATPTGKQNSFAARNLPSLVMAVATERTPASLANAFVKPSASPCRTTWWRSRPARSTPTGARSPGCTARTE